MHLDKKSKMDLGGFSHAAYQLYLWDDDLAWKMFQENSLSVGVTNASQGEMILLFFRFR